MRKALLTIPDGEVRKYFFDDSVIKYFEENFEVTYNTLGREFTKEELEKAAEGKDLVVTGWGTPYFGDSAVFSETSTVKLIAHTGGSTGDMLDLDIYGKGFHVISGNRLFAESVAEGTIGYMLMALRYLPEEVINMKNGGWKGFGFLDSRSLLDSTVGIIGYGMISRQLMKMLKAFRVKIKIFSMYEMDKEFLDEVNATYAPLEEIFATCPVVSLHSALTENTEGLIGKEHLSLMKPGSVFINTARAAIVRYDELLEVLKEKKISAVLDVYHNEPPACDDELRTLENVYCIAHKAGPAVDRLSYISMSVIKDAVRFFNGEKMENEITCELAERMTRNGV